MDTNKHKFLMMQILKDIYKDSLLSSCLAFKGGTSLMFFYQLTRFSVDLDFNLLDCTKQHVVYEKLQKIAHKLCALLDRKGMTGRDVFDCYFFLSHTSINKNIVEYRMGMPLKDYIQKCVDAIQNFSNKSIMNNIGELLDGKEKNFVRTKLKKDTVDLLRFFSEFPSIQEYHDSKMVVDKSVIEQKNNDNWEIKAVIDGKEYDSKQISASDKQLYCSLNMEEEKAGLAIIFAKKYFVNEYNRNQ